MRQLYNEGRVVGLSSYELYVRQLLSTNPTTQILNERQWLSASLSSNISMVLKIPAGTRAGIHNYFLPEGSDLCGCTVIYASIFEGEVAVGDNDNWGRRVDDYGRLISNVPELHPETPGYPEDVPTKPDPFSMGAFAQQCREYMKITAALMFQPGNWRDNVYFDNLLTEASEEIVTQTWQELLVPRSDHAVPKSIEPDFNELGFIRLAITQDITTDFYILFNGFSYKTLASGEVGFNQMDVIGAPANGDYLGPAIFPWGCRIVLTISNEVLTIVNNDIRDLGSQQSMIASNVAALATTSARLTSELSSLTTTVGTLAGNLSTLASTVNSISNTVGTIQTGIAGLSEEIGTIQSDISDINTDLGGLSNQIESLDTRVTEIEHELHPEPEPEPEGE